LPVRLSFDVPHGSPQKPSANRLHPPLGRARLRWTVRVVVGRCRLTLSTHPTPRHPTRPTTAARASGHPPHASSTLSTHTKFSTRVDRATNRVRLRTFARVSCRGRAAQQPAKTTSTPAHVLSKVSIHHPSRRATRPRLVGQSGSAALLPMASGMVARRRHPHHCRISRATCVRGPATQHVAMEDKRGRGRGRRQ